MEPNTSPTERPNYPLFMALSATYLALHAVLRWLRWTIFHGHGAYGWKIPDAADYGQMVFSSSVPFFAAFTLLFIGTRNVVTSRARLVMVAFVVLCVTLLIELDASWFSLSKRHVGLSEVKVFLAEDWRHDIGLRFSDMARFAALIGCHAVVLGLFVWFAMSARGLRRRISRSSVFFVIVVLVISVADILLTGSRVAANDPQWKALVYRHPLRIAGLDALVGRSIGTGNELDWLNSTFRATVVPSASNQSNPLSSGITHRLKGKTNVIVVVIEGLNSRLADTLPTWTRLRDRSIVGAQHYSTGDATHYGILGLTHGMPMIFYGRDIRPQSEYVDALNDAGYLTRRFGAHISSFGQIDSYTENFRSKGDDLASDMSMLDDLVGYLAEGNEPKFAFAYYHGTHWPYMHSSRYKRHLPEVPDDFDYSVWNLAEYRSMVENRYLNALDEMDDWLAQFVSRIDLSRTAVVITADHGEEMFERGRMSHAGGCWELQLRVPLLVLLPGEKPRQLNTLTSHAHVLPAILDWLGIEHASRKGLRPDGPIAIAGHNNHTLRPREWALVTPALKVHFSAQTADDIEITSLTDHHDRPLTRGAYGEQEVIDALEQLRGFQRDWKAFN